MTRRGTLPVLLVLGAACATSRPEGAPLPAGEPSIVVHVAGDGFVRVGERRIPLDALVLELRQRARKMTDDERLRFVVQIYVDPQPRGSDGERVAARGKDRLIDELGIMEMGQVVLF